MIVRLMKKKDKKALRRLYFIARYKTFTWEDARYYQLRDFDEVCRGELVLVALIQKTLVGFVAIDRSENFIHNLFVDGRVHRKGVGKLLLEAALIFLERPAQLKCAISNYNARKFYTHLGWFEQERNVDNDQHILFQLN